MVLITYGWLPLSPPPSLPPPPSVVSCLYKQTLTHLHLYLLNSFAILLILDHLSCSNAQDKISSKASKSSTKSNAFDKYGSIPSQSSRAPSNNDEDEFDDFDPRGTSNTSMYL